MVKPDMSRYIGIKPQNLPTVWYPIYVVYRYNFSESTYIVSFECEQKADAFQNETLAKPHTVRCEIFGHFPRELLK